MKNTFVNHSVKEVLMRTLTLAMLATLFLFVIACGKDNTVDIAGTLPVDVSGNMDTDNHVANWDPSQCFSDEDCVADQLCVHNEAASKELKFDVSRCETGCDVEFFTVQNEDGTGATTKDGDSCQRDGDTTVFCHPEQFVCTPYKVVEPDPDPVDPTPDPQAEFYSITCCYQPNLFGNGQDYRVNFGAGTKSETGGLLWNTQMESTGCGTSEGFYAIDQVTKGFWTELTDGPVSDQHDNWKGTGENGEFVPLYCIVNTVTYKVGTHAQSCGFGTFDAVNEDGTSDSCLE